MNASAIKIAALSLSLAFDHFGAQFLIRRSQMTVSLLLDFTIEALA